MGSSHYCILFLLGLGERNLDTFWKVGKNKAAVANHGGFSTSHPSTVKSLNVVDVMCVYRL